MKNSKCKKADKTNYSPINQMKKQQQKHQQQHALRKSNANYSNQVHLGDHIEADFVDDENLRHTNNYLQSSQLKLDNRATNQREILTPSPIEEVYLCSCCGVTKELDPAMKYMPIFRNLFYPFNFFVFAFGLANLGMGLWFRIDPKVYEIHKYIETQNFTIAGWILLFGGFLACLIAIIGFAASFGQKAGLLIVYCSVLILLTCSFIGTVVLLTVHGFGIQLEQFFIKEIYEQMRRRTMNTEVDLFMNKDAAPFLDFVQVKMRCCGATDFRDYQKLGMVIPTTCYTFAGNLLNAPGCGRALRELFDIRAGLAAGFTTGSAIAQLFTTILSALMACSIYNWRANPRPTTTVVESLRSSPSPSPNASHRHELDYDHQSTQMKRFHNEQQHFRPPSRLSSIAV